MTAALSVTCPHCGNPPGMRCGSVSGWARKPHKRRVILAAHSDTALDEWFPLRNPCGVCGWLPQRHRVVDAIAGRLAAGEDLDEVADDHGLSVAAVEAVTEWAAKWPDAWKLGVSRRSLGAPRLAPGVPGHEVAYNLGCCSPFGVARHGVKEVPPQAAVEPEGMARVPLGWHVSSFHVATPWIVQRTCGVAPPAIRWVS